MLLVPPPGPLRLLAIAALVNTLGNGLFYTSAALFYTRSVGLSPGQVGLGLTVAGLLGLLVGIPAGHLADLRGAREVLVVTLVLEAAAMSSFALVHGFPGFLAASIAYICVDKASNAVRQGLIASAFPAEERVSGRAYLRSVTNLGIGVGSAIAGVAIAIDTREAYVAMVLADALTYLGCAAVIARLPRREGAVRKAEEGGMLIALRDRPYLAVTAVGAVLNMHYVLLEIAVPLWVDRYTSAPRWTVALLFLLNTACCVLLQVRMSRSAHDVPSSARTQRTGGLLVAASCVVFALSEDRSAALAVGVLVVAALVNVAGELLQASGSWGLGFGLAPETSQGQYQGLYSTGFAAANMLGPVVVTATVIAWGTPGWLLMGAVFAAAGIVTVPVVAWAERTRALAA
ncbi:MAG: hypothetical protein JWO12_1843 [Frankiales bacterium]|nr:hypothetical protein [Frankiales bacterium]